MSDATPRVKALEERSAVMDAELARWTSRGYFVEEDDGLRVAIGHPNGSRFELRVTDDLQVLTRSLDATTSPYSNPLVIAGFVCAGLVIIGSVGPWISNPIVSAAGTDGDGVITLILGAVAAALLFFAARSASGMSRAMQVLTALAFIVAAFVGGNVVNNVWSADEGIIRLSVGWGLWMVMLGSIAGALLVMVSSKLAR